MTKIPTIKNDDGSIAPSEPYPSDSILVIAAEDFYTCYQHGDELPHMDY